MKLIPLTKGYFTKVDDEDYEKFVGMGWGIQTRYMRAFKYIKRNGHWVTLYLHREIMNAPKDKLVDHINRDGLDNRKKNLRLCNKSQNAANCIKRKRNTSGYKGVSWDKSEKRWVIQTMKDGKVFFGGRFNNKEEAAKAYNTMAVRIHGEFARTNKIK